METWAPAPARRRSPRARAALVVGCAAVLVVGVVSVRDGTAGTSADDLDRISDAVRRGCENPTADLGASAGFALDGTVLAVAAPTDPGAPVVVDLAVHEWFRGPPLDRTRVRLAAGTVADLHGAGAALEPGLRLLVSGRGWGTGEDAPTATGCGGTAVWDTSAAAGWREEIPAAEPVDPVGPVPRYPDAGFVRVGPDAAPALTGVLLLDDGCLYVDDGITRWVPVLPASGVTWVDAPPQLGLGTDVVDVGHPVRLGGLPATGLLSGPRPLRADEVRADRLDERGVPDGCRSDAPRFVVADPAEQGPATVLEVSDDDPLLRAAVDGAESAGLGPGRAVGQVRRDQFGAHSARVALQTDRAGEVLVHVENVAFLAWPFAYAPTDASFRWSLNPEQATRLPQAPPGSQLAVVERADGTTQVLVRSGERVVVSASADPFTAPGEPVEGDALVAALAEVASRVAEGGPRTPPG